MDSSGVERELSLAEKQAVWDQRYRVSTDGSLAQEEATEGFINFSQFAKQTKAFLTLSGLLNCLDGPMSKDGRIICLTTNAPDNLDPALIRAGRCDHRVHFGYVSTEISVRLFTHLYTKRPEELVDDESSASEQYDIPNLAQTFAASIPQDSMISPAEVQDYLMKHCHDPQAAVEGAAEFARHIIEIKAQGRNVASYLNEVQTRGQSSSMPESSQAGSEASSEEYYDISSEG